MMPAYNAVLFAPPAPVTQVTLGNPQTGQTVADIPLLIDSGADVTLIPQLAVDRLGLRIDSAETYELQSFDQHISTAHPVILERVFLNRTFRVSHNRSRIWGTRSRYSQPRCDLAGWPRIELARIKLRENDSHRLSASRAVRKASSAGIPRTFPVRSSSSRRSPSANHNTSVSVSTSSSIVATKRCAS